MPELIDAYNAMDELRAFGKKIDGLSFGRDWEGDTLTISCYIQSKLYKFTETVGDRDVVEVVNGMTERFKVIVDNVYKI